MLSMPLYDSAPFNLVRDTGEFATIASVIQALFIYFSTKMADLSTRFTGVKDLCILYQNGRLVNKIHRSEGFVHFML